MTTRSAWRKGVLTIAIPAFLLAGCAQTPMGPTVQVMPGSGKPFEAFQADQFACKQYSEQSVAGQAENANTRGVGAAALTTVLGAGLGAAIGGGRGAGIGAASGALGGAGIGAASSSNAQMTIQQQYDNAYSQCMYAKGNMVPGYMPMMQQAPPVSPYNPGLVRAVQLELIRTGYLRGGADGTVGPQTATAISQYEAAAGMPVDGLPSPALLGRLQQTP